MTNFDLDDPLGDLLSDGSNDSFFDEPKPKPISNKPSIAKTPEKKSVHELFGLEENARKSDDWLGTSSKDANPAPVPRERAQKKISFEDDDDVMNTLGLEADSKPNLIGRNEVKKIDASKKSSLMESILGSQKEDDKKFLSLDDLLKDSKFNKKPVDVPPEVSQSTSQIPQKQETSSLEFTRESRRTRPKTSGLADPLGLFADTKPVEAPTISRPRTAQSPKPEIEIIYQTNKDIKTTASDTSEIPDWLGGSGKTNKPETVETKIERIPSRKNSITLIKPMNQELPQMDTINSQNINMDSLMTQQKLATSHIEYQNTSIALQQQESQLLMALQLRKYEDNLSDMQRKQQEILVKQEQQFNNLLERQFTKQTIMENNMRLQQERINGHIQMLISQPPVSGTLRQDDETLEKLEELKKNNSEETIKQFEDMIANLKQRQHEEMFLLEESYKKQISTLEQSMESVENHLKTEIDSLSHKQKEKLNNLQDEHEADVIKYKNKIEEIHTNHGLELKQMRENHVRVIEEIKYEQNLVIENIKQSKQLENNAMGDAKDYAQKLDQSLKLLEINSSNLLGMKEKVVSDYSVLSLAREESLKAKEAEIKLMRLALEKSRELADEDRAQLMSLVRTLEIKLAEQSQNSREERCALQQAASLLSARTLALDREADFNRTSLERERDQLKNLRESILCEQEKTMLQLTEEKLSIQTERTRLETTNKLSQNYDSQRAKTEIDAAIKVAKEATELTDRERENLIRQQRDVELFKRNLKDRECKLNSREKDIEQLTKMAENKFKDGERSLDDARMIQSNYNERLHEIQVQLVSLTNREKRLAEEKIALSKERVAFHNLTKHKKCGLCAVDDAPRIDDDLSDAAEHDIPRFMEHEVPRFISTNDADMFRLQLQMSEDQLTSSHIDERNSNH